MDCHIADQSLHTFNTCFSGIFHGIQEIMGNEDNELERSMPSMVGFTGQMFLVQRLKFENLSTSGLSLEFSKQSIS